MAFLIRIIDFRDLINKVDQKYQLLHRFPISFQLVN